MNLDPTSWIWDNHMFTLSKLEREVISNKRRTPYTIRMIIMDLQSHHANKTLLRHGNAPGQLYPKSTANIWWITISYLQTAHFSVNSLGFGVIINSLRISAFWIKCAYNCRIILVWKHSRHISVQQRCLSDSCWLYEYPIICHTWISNQSKFHLHLQRYISYTSSRIGSSCHLNESKIENKESHKKS